MRREGRGSASWLIGPPNVKQDAPELNEENFPSLGSNGSIGERPDALPQASKGGFAEAVKTPASPAPSPPPKTEATPDAGGHRHRASPTEGTRSMAPTQVPWKETGEQERTVMQFRIQKLSPLSLIGKL